MSNGDDVLDNWEDLDEAGINSTLVKLKAANAAASALSVTDNFLAADGSFVNSTDNHPYSHHLHSNQDPSRDRVQESDHFWSSGASSSMKLLQRPSRQDAGNSSMVSPSSGAMTTEGSATSAMSRQESVGRGAVSALDSMADSFRPVMMLLQKPPDESQSGNYTSPMVNQTVKILRRPTQSGECRLSDLKPKQPLKSLKQREQEYAEARLRILGAAKNPEDEGPSKSESSSNSVSTSTEQPATIATTTSPVTSPITTSPNPSAIVATKTTPTRSTSAIATPSFNNNSLQQQQQQQQQQHQQGREIGNPLPLPTPILNQYPNFPYTPQLFYYQMQQQQQQAKSMHHSSKAIPEYNHRGMNMPLLISPPPSHGPLGQSLQYHHQQQQQQHLNYQQQLCQDKNLPSCWSPALGVSLPSKAPQSKPASTAMSNIRPPNSHLSHHHQIQDSILRLPRGPDGSMGFQMRR